MNSYQAELYRIDSINIKLCKSLEPPLLSVRESDFSGHEQKFSQFSEGLPLFSFRHLKATNSGNKPVLCLQKADNFLNNYRK